MGVAGVAIAQQGAGGAGAAGQQPDVNKLNTSSADIQAMIAKAKMDAKPGQANVNSRIVHLGGGTYQYTANLEYRPIAGPAAVHVHEAEMFYVIDGSCTFVTGGKLVEPKQTNPENLAGTAIEGGTTTTLSKGDFLLVPENTPHQVTAVIGGPVVFMTLHVPRQAAGVASTSAGQ